MDGENLSPELRRQSGRIERDSAILVSFLSTDDSGILRTEATAKEAEELKQGQKPSESSILQRFITQAASFREITVSIDAAFFDDGTFVGPDTSNFFSQTQAVINAKRDFLNELAAEMANPGKDRNSFDGHLREIATQPIESIDSSSTPADYYNYFKKLSVSEFLQIKEAQGKDKAVAMAKRQMNQSWATLRKKD